MASNCEANNKSTATTPPEEHEPIKKTPLQKWGFDLYPERRSERYKPSLSRQLILGESTIEIDRIKCQERVFKVMSENPMIKLMLGALKKAGCPFDLSRHVSCEICDHSLLGGYDQDLNQIVVCQNVSTSEGRTRTAIAHELVHMFDYCTNYMDFQNLDHLACSEIRAANLTSCSYITAVSLQPSALFNIKKSHEECVKTKAAWSIKYARNIPEEEARAAVNRVFTKCYNDLEPVGRRIRRNSNDPLKAFKERYIMDYV